MLNSDKVLGASAAKAYYDRFGKKQDSQGFYEDPALDDLVNHSGFQDCRQVFEFGCGTGKFAARLLEKHLPPAARYLGCDVSHTMTELAKRRIGVYGERAQVALSDGEVRFPLPDHSVDRVVCSYVLDLLSHADITRFLREAQRVLTPGGKICIASLTVGIGVMPRIVSTMWMSVFRLDPALVGGCRPIQVDAFVSPQDWKVVHRRILTPWGVPSEVLILETNGPRSRG